MVTSLGNDDRVAIVGEDAGISGVSAGSMEIAVVDPNGMKVVSESAGVRANKHYQGRDGGPIRERPRGD
jgi:hypothetical protein